MINFRIINLSGSLSLKARFDILQDGDVCYKAIEYSPNFYRNLFGFTKLRMLFPLKMKLTNIKTQKFFFISRGFSLLAPQFEVKAGSSPFIFFKRGKIKNIHLNYEITDSFGRAIGLFIFKKLSFSNIHGELQDSDGNIIAKFEWKNFSIWKGFKECELQIFSEDEHWVIISIVSAIIRGLYSQWR